MNDFSLLDFFMASVSFSLAVLGLVIAVIMPLIDRWSRRFFIILFIDLVLCMTLFLVNAIICLEPVTVNHQLILWFFESLFLSIPIPMFTIYLLHCCGENMKGSTLMSWICSSGVLSMSLSKTTSSADFPNPQIPPGFYLIRGCRPIARLPW